MPFEIMVGEYCTVHGLSPEESENEITGLEEEDEDE
jgi:hypothetical protein